MTPAERTLCAATSRWMSAHCTVVGAVGLAAALVAALLLMSGAPLPAFATCALLLTLAERTLALRTRFDAGLFADLARHPGPLEHLDAALADLQLRQPTSAPRPLLERVRGAQRLARWHLLLALVQFGAVGLQLLWAGWGQRS